MVNVPGPPRPLNQFLHTQKQTGTKKTTDIFNTRTMWCRIAYAKFSSVFVILAYLWTEHIVLGLN